MLTNAHTANGLSKQETGYLEAVEECVQEMASVSKGMKKADAEIRQLRAANRRKLDETWAIIRRVQATL